MNGRVEPPLDAVIDLDQSVIRAPHFHLEAELLEWIELRDRSIRPASIVNGQAEMTDLNGMIAGAFSSEDIGIDRRPLSRAQAALAAGILAFHQRRQTLERTGHGAGRLGRHTRTERGHIELAVPEQSRPIMRIFYVIETEGSAWWTCKWRISPGVAGSGGRLRSAAKLRTKRT